MRGNYVLIFAAVIAFVKPISIEAGEDVIYGYECQHNKCVKVELNAANREKAICLSVCRLFCGATQIGTVWPQPEKVENVENFMIHVDLDAISFEFPPLSKQTQLWEENRKRFRQMLENSVQAIEELKSGGHSLKVIFDISGAANEVPKLTFQTDERYTLAINSSNENAILVKITADNFFGARHGMETLSQLIVYDDIRDELQVVAGAYIEDSPMYPWRGLLLDTSRHFYSVKSLKRTLDAMAMVKLNTFHWHITDTQSFPLEIKSQPELSKLGAFSARKVYTQEKVTDIVEYGRARGIRVMPEFDAPAHVGEGWQHKDMTACFKYQPWIKYCGEAPCGQLDPTVEELYPVLEDIYREMFELFSPDVFHMGGDEVLSRCWNSSERIQSWMKTKGWNLEESDFLRLWGYFQEKALDRVDRVAKLEKPLIILWTSHLTDAPYIDEYLDKNRYIIQIWTKGYDPKVQDILKRGFRTIISNNDALYFDCGGPGWVSDGNNWCSPYIGWQKVYNNKLEMIAGDYKSLVLGAEAAVWSEQIDELSLDARLWPRASALAERLWSDPIGGWREAEARLLYHRERLVNNEIRAEAMQPEWCLQNENQCPAARHIS